jgi:hypothetical protein
LALIPIVLLEVSAASQSLKKNPVEATDQEPRLVQAIIVDQFRYDYLLRFGDDFREGLQQLLTRACGFCLSDIFDRSEPRLVCRFKRSVC